MFLIWLPALPDQISPGPAILCNGLTYTEQQIKAADFLPVVKDSRRFELMQKKTIMTVIFLASTCSSITISITILKTMGKQLIF